MDDEIVEKYNGNYITINKRYYEKRDKTFIGIYTPKDKIRIRMAIHEEYNNDPNNLTTPIDKEGWSFNREITVTEEMNIDTVIEFLKKIYSKECLRLIIENERSKG